MNNSQKARARLFRSRRFRAELATYLGLGGLAQQVAACVDALLEARRLPSAAEDNSFALAMDGALIISSLGSIPKGEESVIPVTDRFCAMKFQCEVGCEATIERPPADGMWKFPSISFGTDVIALFQNLWIAPSEEYVRSFCPAVSLLKGNANGDILIGVLDQLSKKRKRIYSNAYLPIPEGVGSDCFSPPSFGGIFLMPAAIANLALLLEVGVAQGPATIASNR